jgi:hypothetical protein
LLQVIEVTEECLGSAWKLFEKLEMRVAEATSMAAKSVHRNKIGYKQKNFKPLR